MITYSYKGRNGSGKVTWDSSIATEGQEKVDEADANDVIGEVETSGALGKSLLFRKSVNIKITFMIMIK